MCVYKTEYYSALRKEIITVCDMGEPGRHYTVRELSQSQEEKDS